jgi:hypothetical protein
MAPVNLVAHSITRTERYKWALEQNATSVETNRS